MSMKSELPPPITRYFGADRLDGAAVASCFTVDAVVEDEGGTHAGQAAIAQWKAETSDKYHATAEPLSAQQQAEMTVVTTRLSGEFKGSPVTVRFLFELASGKISRLVIKP
jgi:hypothetical protein